MGDQKTKQFPTKEMCKGCQCETWHKILNETENSFNDEESEIWENTKFYTLQCLGCDNICLLTESTCSEDRDPETGEFDIEKNIYPSPFKSDRDLMNRIHYAPKNITLVYSETIKAFNFEMMILVGIGIRATIEAIAIEQKITGGTLEIKIKKMVDNNIITPDGAKLLRLVKNIGNNAAHKIKKHHHDDLSLCIDIVEDVIRSLYIFPKEAEQTRQVIDGEWERS